MRFQAEGKLPPSVKPRYNGVIHAFRTIAKTEGISALYRGVIPTVQRAAIVNAAELATYDQAKGFLIANNITGDTVYGHFGASLMAGFVATVFSNPVDLMKTRIMNQKPNADGTLPYKGTIDCFLKTVRNEGFLALYKGFIPNYGRLGPWCIIMFMTFEQFKNFAQKI